MSRIELVRFLFDGRLRLLRLGLLLSDAVTNGRRGFVTVATGKIVALPETWNSDPTGITYETTS